MKRWLGVLAVALSLGEAQAASRESVIAELRQGDFTEIRVRRTWLGRTRFIATGPRGSREIVLNPSSGEILRDHFEPRAATRDGRTPTGPIRAPAVEQPGRDGERAISGGPGQGGSSGEFADDRGKGPSAGRGGGGRGGDPPSDRGGAGADRGEADDRSSGSEGGGRGGGNSGNGGSDSADDRGGGNGRGNGGGEGRGGGRGRNGGGD